MDGRELDVREGQTVLEAAREHGIEIPSLCYHPKIGPAGRCRACVVEVEGQRGLKESCALSVSDGMVVHTNTDRVRDVRRMIVELHLATGKHDLNGGDHNELARMARDLGVTAPSFSYAYRYVPIDDSSQGIIRDLNKCIQCGRCVAACNRIVVNEVLEFGGRGHSSHIVCDDNLPMGESSCVQCGECVQVCPTGSLSLKALANKDISGATTTKVTCPYCGVGCQIDLHVKDNKILYSSVHEQNWNLHPNKGMLCVKGRFGLDFVHSPERLTTPMIRREKGGALEPCSWNTALDFTAQKLSAIKQESGADSLFFLASAKVSNEENYAMMRLARGVVGTHNIDHCARL
jgi:predicted molibdopterin-dependent oxidoreductase YjgC